jgi:hypothetical protein
MARRRKPYVGKLEDWELADERFGLAEMQARAELAMPTPSSFFDLFENLSNTGKRE